MKHESKKYKNRDWLYNKYIDDDLTLKKISNICDVSISTISRWKKKLNISKQSKDTPYRDEDWLREQYIEKKKAITDIAEDVGVDHTTISKWKRRFNIKTRSRSVKMKCPICGKEFSRYKSSIKDVKYTNVCSLECLYKARSMGIIKREVDGGYDCDNKDRYKVNCEVCGKEFKVIKSKLENDNKGKYCSRECYEEAKSDMMSGENNPEYIDGRSYERMKFRGKKWRKIRKEVIKRDNYECVMCGMSRDEHIKRYNQDLHVHHIIPYRKVKSNKKENLKTVCVKCHKKIENGDEDE